MQDPVLIFCASQCPAHVSFTLYFNVQVQMCLFFWTVNSLKSESHLPLLIFPVSQHIFGTWQVLLKCLLGGMNGFINHKCQRNVTCLITCVWYKLTSHEAFKCSPCSSAPSPAWGCCFFSTAPLPPCASAGFSKSSCCWEWSPLVQECGW